MLVLDIEVDIEQVPMPEQRSELESFEQAALQLNGLAGALGSNGNLETAPVEGRGCLGPELEVGGGDGTGSAGDPRG